MNTSTSMSSSTRVYGCVYLSCILFSLSLTSTIISVSGWSVTPSITSTPLLPHTRSSTISTLNSRTSLYLSSANNEASNTVTVTDTDNDNNNDNDNNIVILGGGFGGLNTALTLDSLPWQDPSKKPRIILVDNKERFVFLPLLYELCVGDAELKEVAPTFQSLMQNSDNIEFIQRDIQGIDIDTQNVYLTKTSSSTKSTSTSTECIPYKSLVVATGSSINLSSINGATQYALPFYTIQDCYELRKQLSILDLHIQEKIKEQKKKKMKGSPNKAEEISIVIVGGGYSGVELALNLKERLAVYENGNGNDDNGDGDDANVSIPIRITMLHRGKEVLQYATEHNRSTGQKRLKDAGIDIQTEQSVIEVLPPSSSSETTTTATTTSKESGLKYRCQIKTNKSTFDADILLWTAGSMSKNEPRDILNSKLPRDNSGRIITNQLLRVKDSTNVYALGDCARINTRNRKEPYAATAAVAMQQAPVAAWNVFASTQKRDMEMDESNNSNSNIKGGIDQYEELAFSYLDLGSMMTLGGEDATISTPIGSIELDGSIASVARRLIYAVRMPTLQQALTAAVSSTNKRLEKSSLKKVKKVIEWK